VRKAVFYPKADAVPSKPPALTDSALKKQVCLLIRQTFGEETVSWTARDEGTFHRVFFVTAPPQDFVIKVGLYDEQRLSLALENQIHSTILGQLFIGLQVYEVDVTCSTYPFPYLILERAQGKRLREQELDSPEIPLIVAELGRVVAQMHAIPGPGGWGLLAYGTRDEDFRLCGSSTSWKDYIFTNLYSHVHNAYAYGVLDAKAHDFIHHFFSDGDRLFEVAPAKALLHGDLGSHNVFFATNGSPQITALIDWEDALAGDPAFDVASFASFFRMHEFLEAFLTGYCDVGGALAEDFELRLWTYYLRIVLAKATLRIRLGYDRGGASISKPKIAMAIDRLRAKV